MSMLIWPPMENWSPHSPNLALSSWISFSLILCFLSNSKNSFRWSREHDRPTGQAFTIPVRHSIKLDLCFCCCFRETTSTKEKKKKKLYFYVRVGRVRPSKYFISQSSNCFVRSVPRKVLMDWLKRRMWITYCFYYYYYFFFFWTYFVWFYFLSFSISHTTIFSKHKITIGIHCRGGI